MKRSLSPRRMAPIIAAVIALGLVAVACGDDGEPPPTADGAIADGNREQGAREQPLATDFPIPLDYGPPTDLPPGSGSNSGAICSATKPCPATEEVCIYFGSKAGMCLSPCKNKGDACRVAQEFAQISTCSIKGLDGKWHCGFFCLLGGTPFKCPNATDYKCVPAGKAGFSFCEPK